MDRLRLRRAINLDRRDRDLDRKRQALAEVEAEMEALRAATPDRVPPAAALPPDSAECDLVAYPVLAPRQALVRASDSPRRLRAIFKSDPVTFFHDHPKRVSESWGHIQIGIAVPPMPSHDKAEKVARKRRAREPVVGGEELYAHIVGLKR